jgi:hypothetical protein
MKRPLVIIALGCYLLIALVSGAEAIVSNLNVIWMNPGFSGWTTAIAERIAAGMMLYTDGGHLPMSPLPFLLIYAASFGDPLWFHEELLIQTANFLIVVTLFLGTLRIFPAPVAFLAGLIVQFTLFSDIGGLFYNNLALLMAVISMVIALQITLVPASALNEPLSKSWFSSASKKILLLGFVLATGILSKQNIGLGAALGAGLTLLLLPAHLAFKQRFCNAFILTAATVVFFALWCLVLSPFISIEGMLTDVFLSGSEPKGGPDGALARLMLQVKLVSRWIMRPDTLIAVSILAAAGWFGTRSTTRKTQVPGAPTSNMLLIVLTVLVILVSILLIAGAELADIKSADARRALSRFLFIFLHTVLLLGLVPNIRRMLANALGINPGAIVAIVVLAYPTFLMGQISMPGTAIFIWKWGIQLFFLGLALLLLCGYRLSEKLPTVVLQKTGLITLAALSILMGLALCATKYTSLLACDQEWPGVAALEGVKMPSKQEPYLTLLQKIRDLTPDPDDEVFLLPEDPSFESFIARKRPDVTSAIYFMDTYQDDFIAEDLKRLDAKPPAVIVIGPQSDFWWQGLYFRPEDSWGTLRLIKLIRAEILPRHYTLAFEMDVPHAGGNVTEIVSVYTRLDPLNPNTQ